MKIYAGVRPVSGVIHEALSVTSDVQAMVSDDQISLGDEMHLFRGMT